MLDTNAPTQKQTDHFLHILNTMFNSLPSIGLYLVLAVIVIILLVFIIKLALRILGLSRLINQDNTFIELTPLAFTDKELFGNTELFSVLHSLMEARSLKDKILIKSSVFVPEIVSTRDKGVRYIVRVPKSYRHTLERGLASAYKSSISFKEIEDYIPVDLSLRKFRVSNFKMTGNFGYPLKHILTHDTHDPVSYLLGTMTHLRSEEMMALQLVITPVKVKDAGKTARDLLRNNLSVDSLNNTQSKPFLRIINNGIIAVMDEITGGIGEISNGPSSYKSRHPEVMHKQQVAAGIVPARTLSQLEQKLSNTVYEKLSQPLFKVSIRALVISNSEQRVNDNTSDISNSLSTYKTNHQSLKTSINLPFKIYRNYSLFMFRHRLPSLLNRKNNILSSTEISDIYHFPHSESGRIENTVESYSRTLESSVAIKNNADNGNFDIILGTNKHHGSSTTFGLTAEERERHVLITGGTGNGKTTLMKYAILQDIQNGKGVAVIDPHGDLADDILKQIPESRIKDVIFFDPKDIDHPIGMNLLELPPKIKGNDSLLQKSLIEDAVIAIMRKVFSLDDTGGHRIEYILRNCVRTAYLDRQSTLLSIYKLLTNFSYRKAITDKIEDETLSDFWTHVYGKAGSFQKTKMGQGVIEKIDRFQASAPVMRVFGQSKSTIDFDDIMDSGKILICKFDQGNLGADTSALFGTTVLAKLQLAANRRQSIDPKDRRPFYLYVDEFQNFSMPIFEQFLSQARKYKLYLTLAEQSTTQQADQRVVETFFSNIGTFITFRSGSPKDEAMLLPLYSPYIEEGEIARLDAYNFYCLIKGVKTQSPISGTTIEPARIGGNGAYSKVINSSRSNYGGKVTAVRKSKVLRTASSSSNTSSSSEKASNEELAGMNN